MKKLVAIAVGYVVACAVSALGVVAMALYGPIPHREEVSMLTNLGLDNLFSVLPIVLLVALPGFVLLRVVLHLLRSDNVLSFAVAGAVNSLIVLSLSGGFLGLGWAVALFLGLAAGTAQWGLERLVNYGPVVPPDGAV